MAGSVHEDMKDFIETWESVTPTTNFVIKLDARGEHKQEGVIGARTFKISTYERMITQDEIEDPKLDPFKNGCFRPVVVPSDITVETNPNALSDEDIDRIFKASDFAWDEYMKTIDSPSTFRRMVERAEDAEVSLKRFRELEKKLEDSDPERVTRVVQNDQDLFDNLDKPSGSRGRPRKKPVE